MYDILTLDPGDSLGTVLERLRAQRWDAVRISLSHPDADEAVIELVAREPHAGALILSVASPSLRASLLAARVGALGLLYEPVDPAELHAIVAEASGSGRSVPLPEEAGTGPFQLVGTSPPMGRVYDMIARAAPSESTVLVTGESGTGKELVARALHAAGPRADGPFVAINCAAIPEALLESELFGHEKGAFTGAISRRAGRFERAAGGTLFLDEIGDMQPLLQAKLLRALEERVIERVGSDTTWDVDVRVIAATHRDLRARIADGTFREDLLFRLSVLEIALPPLRERRTDIEPLALHFARLSVDAHEKDIHGFQREALDTLTSADWPGNVRELRNVVDRAVVLTSGSTIGVGALRLGPASPHAAPTGATPEAGYPLDATLAEIEADHIRRVLEANDHQIAVAAEVLGVHRNTLSRKIRDLGLGRNRGAPA